MSCPDSEESQDSDCGKSDRFKYKCPDNIMWLYFTTLKTIQLIPRCGVDSFCTRQLPHPDTSPKGPIFLPVTDSSSHYRVGLIDQDLCLFSSGGLP